nr:immunoglobulin heavy chain junction region [Macaca mulatta]
CARDVAGSGLYFW